jgi:hypothetical protein
LAEEGGQSQQRHSHRSVGRHHQFCT